MKFIKLMLLDLLYFTEVRNKMYQFVIGVQPLVFLFLLKFMTSLSDTFQSSFILSIGIMSGWAFVLYSSGVAIVGERWVGTLELIIHTKTSLFTIIIAKAINTALLGIGTILLTILYSPLFFQVNIGRLLTTYIVDFVFIFLSLASMAFFLSVVFSFAIKNVYAYQNFLFFPILILSGNYYPITLLPQWMSILSKPIPLTWSILLTQKGHTLSLIICCSITSFLLFTIGSLLLSIFSKTLKETMAKGGF
ncbi:ABC transporter permease [Fictibacillus enclensis]|uniref:ABC transporter permease n=1 Tax=Fictibacillus enclensis TaxID=1017270 RepID=UPI0025A2891F|nr:ABC transporter permease [Fictibacillus enclensis]MDM5335821.1 ABC transporter permease [Fictibacillus enclensis]